MWVVIFCLVFCTLQDCFGFGYRNFRTISSYFIPTLWTFAVYTMTRLIYGFFPLSQDSCRQKTEHRHIMWRKSSALKLPIILITVVILSPSSWQRHEEMHMMQLSSWRRSIWLLEKEIELLTVWSIVKKSTIINGFRKAGLLRVEEGSDPTSDEAIQLRHRRRWLQWFQCTGGGR